MFRFTIYLMVVKQGDTFTSLLIIDNVDAFDEMQAEEYAKIKAEMLYGRMAYIGSSYEFLGVPCSV